LQCPQQSLAGSIKGLFLYIDFGLLLNSHNAQPQVAQNGGSQNAPFCGLLHLNKVPQAFFQVRKNTLFRVEMI